MRRGTGVLPLDLVQGARKRICQFGAVRIKDAIMRGKGDGGNTNKAYK